MLRQFLALLLSLSLFPAAPTKLNKDQRALHAASRLTFGPTVTDLAAIHKLGVDKWIEQQLHPETIPENPALLERLKTFETLQLSNKDLIAQYPRKAGKGAKNVQTVYRELAEAKLLRAVHSTHQLEELMADFWYNHFNVFFDKGADRLLVTSYERDAIRPHVLGNFKNLLLATTKHPAMLFYLDNWTSVSAENLDNLRDRFQRKKAAAKKKRAAGLNENYARELLELHTLGVHGGYSQKDVMEVARCLTGWTVRGTHQSKHSLGKVEFNPDQHDKDAKEVLGKIIPAIPIGVKREEAEILGRNELDQVLEIVGLHPATAKHLAAKLCRRFIADEPPAAAVTAVADAFLRTRGDLGSTLRALFATTEFRTTRANKFKRPFHFIVSALRATDTATDAPPALMEFLVRMGHAPFHYPTPDGYPEAAAPWLGTLLWRWNFAVALADGKIPGVKFEDAALRKCFRGEDELLAHFLGRKAAVEEAASARASGALVPLLLASPGFQKC